MSGIFKPVKPTIDKTNSITSSLVFDAQLYEGLGTTISDIAGSITGTLTNGPTWTVDNPGGLGLIFASASNQFISLSSNPMPNNVGTIATIEALIKPTTLPQGPGFIFHVGQSNNFGFGLSIGNGSGGSGSTLQGLNDNIAWIGSGPTLTNNAVAHVALVKRSAADWFFYLNGVQTDSSSSTTNAGMSPGATIGAEQDSSNVASRFFEGSIYYVRFWTRDLSAAEISSLYANPWRIYNQPSFVNRGLRPRPFAPGIAR